MSNDTDSADGDGEESGTITAADLGFLSGFIAIGRRRGDGEDE